MAIPKPIFLASAAKIPKGARRVDAVSESQEELFVVHHPIFRRQPFKQSPEWRAFLKAIDGKDQWIYFPWAGGGAGRGKAGARSGAAVRLLHEKLYFELRTARNKNLITRAEQEKYRAARVGVAGLSVGSSIIASLVLTGGPQVLKIADFDTLAPSNMNRVRSGVFDLGVAKIELTARDIWNLDPFAKLYLYPKGVTEKNIDQFINGAPRAREPRLDIIIDEMDDLLMKVVLRVAAKRARRPVLMATDYGDSVLLDVERFDLEPRRAIFHGIVGNLTVAQARAAKGPKWFALVEKIIGGKHMPARHRDSLREVGKTLAGVPQLGTDALLAGAAVSLAVRKIANEGLRGAARLKSGRYLWSIENGFRKSI